MAKSLLIDCWMAAKWGIAVAIVFALAAPLWHADVHFQGLLMVFLAVWVLLVLAVIYFIPLTVARRRRHPNTVAIGILNLFLGWTFLGWVAALVWGELCVERGDDPMTARFAGCAPLCGTRAVIVQKLFLRHPADKAFVLVLVKQRNTHAAPAEAV